MEQKNFPNVILWCGRNRQLELLKLKTAQDRKTQSTTEHEIVNDCVSASEINSSQINTAQTTSAETSINRNISENHRVEYSSPGKYRLDVDGQDSQEPTDSKSVGSRENVSYNFDGKDLQVFKQKPKVVRNEATNENVSKKEEICSREDNDTNPDQVTNSVYGKGSTDAPHNEALEEVVTSSDTVRLKNRRQATGHEMKKRKTNRKVPKNRQTLQRTSRIGTRSNSQLYHPHESLETLKYTFPLVRWPSADRLERPEYPSCMEGVEEGLTPKIWEKVVSDSWSEESSDFEEDAHIVPCPRGSSLESCIVPGMLESVAVFCRTSPLLPTSLRPDPEMLRALLHDSCVLQCILRGVAPATIAAYLDTEAAKKTVTNFAKLSDSVIFIGE